MTEKINQHHSVNMTVRMVADGNERSIRQIPEHFRIQDFIFYAYVFQNDTCELRSLAVRVPVIQVIDLVNVQHSHQCSAESVSTLSAKQRRRLFKFIQCQKRHGKL